MHSMPVALVSKANLVPLGLDCRILLEVRVRDIVEFQKVFWSDRWLLFQMFQHVRQQDQIHVFLRVQLSILFLS